MTSAAPARNAGETQVRTSWPSTAIRISVLVCVFLAGAWYEAARDTSLLNSDIWLHLRTGEWILQNHTVPHKALFTRYSDLDWVVPSWGFDLLLAFGVKLLGLRAIPLALMSFKTALAMGTFFLAGGSRGKFWPAAGLAAIVQYIFLRFGPQPAMVSALFLAVELHILLDSRRSGNVRGLRWLPLLFLCWANLDVQFANGLLVLSLYCTVLAVETVQQRFGRDCGNTSLPLKRVALLSLLCAVMTMVSPYSYGSYLTLLPNSIGSLGVAVVDSLQSMNFRQPQHYALLLLTMAAFFTLGQQRSHDWFKVTLLAICAAYAFHWQQDIWFVALPAVAILGEGIGGKTERLKEEYVQGRLRREGVLVAVLTMLLFAVTAARIPAQKNLLGKIAQGFPVKAVDYIREHPMPGPLYNTYAWGGFLTWYLPEYPVAIDGRIPMYGKGINDLFFATATGVLPLDDNPTYRSSRTFLLKRESRLADMTTHSPGFDTVYRDEQSVVVERQDGSPSNSQ